MAGMKLFWMTMALMLVLVTMAKARSVAKYDAGDLLELLKLRALEDDDLYFAARQFNPYNMKNVSKEILSLSLNKSYNT
jgi:hypothetical protein